MINHMCSCTRRIWLLRGPNVAEAHAGAEAAVCGQSQTVGSYEDTIFQKRMRELRRQKDRVARQRQQKEQDKARSNAAGQKLRADEAGPSQFRAEKAGFLTGPFDRCGDSDKQSRAFTGQIHQCSKLIFLGQSRAGPAQGRTEKGLHRRGPRASKKPCKAFLLYQKSGQPS
eukprot:scaffold72386_cov21-Tisochrysis_lutea.AAC.3